MDTRTIDLNQATADELVEANVQGLQEKQAIDVISYRDQYGAFETWIEVEEVPGFTADLVRRMQEAGMTLGQDDSRFVDE